MSVPPVSITFAIDLTCQCPKWLPSLLLVAMPFAHGSVESQNRLWNTAWRLPTCFIENLTSSWE